MSNTPLSRSMLEERVTHLLQVTQALTQILDQENRWLKEHRPSDVKGLAEEKSRLTALYTKELRIIRTHKSQLEDIDGALRKSLAEATKQMQTTLARNERLVVRLKNVSEGLMEAISAEITKRNRPLPSYGDNARIQKDGPMPTTLALDARI